MKSIYIYGASGHGLVVSDIALSCGYEQVIFIDDSNPKYKSFDEIKECCNADIIIAIGDNKTRAKLQEKVAVCGFNIVNLIHKSATISSSAKIGTGVVMMPHVVVNAQSIIGDGVILNSGSIIEHECKIGAFAHISPRVALAGEVSVGTLAHIGIGSCVIQGVHIGANTIIGAGSVVIRDIGDNKKAFGNPCKNIGDTV